MEDKAEIAQHSTTLQAGSFAAAVGARALVLTHFSAR
jgi:ribonuclease Z